ncbi:MAG: carboxypeptidase M32 [Bradymonadia bacterium]
MSYAHLTEHYRQLSHMQNVLGLLQWDMSTMMPKGSAQARAEQVTVMNSACHKLQTNPAVADWLSAAENESLSNWETANLREMARDYRQATALPADLVEALSNAISQCEITWLKARPANDFNELRPHLERVFELTRQKAQVLADASGLSPYDALLDLYEPDCTSAEIDSLFTELTEFLPNLVSEIIEYQQSKGPILQPDGPFDINIQKRIGQKLMANLGFDFDHGRLDVSAHPFCGGSPDDIRITTRYTDQDFSQSIMGVIHETGHALYERGLPASFRGQPVGRARSMGIHESQSLLMEMQACRSPQFISYLAPILRDSFGGVGPAWETPAIQRNYLRVERSLIRVDADEATYPLHVILRYELEKALLSGDLSVKELPGAWNERMRALIGIAPPTDTNGCMQDIHWMMGSVGYFPTYTLGALNAAQLFDAATRDRPEILTDLSEGRFTNLLEWVREKVHTRGSSVSSRELIIDATGQPLDASIFRRHLERRYLERGQ